MRDRRTCGSTVLNFLREIPRPAVGHSSQLSADRPEILIVCGALSTTRILCCRNEPVISESGVGLTRLSYKRKGLTQVQVIAYRHLLAANHCDLPHLIAIEPIGVNMRGHSPIKDERREDHVVDAGIQIALPSGCQGDRRS